MQKQQKWTFDQQHLTAHSKCTLSKLTSTDIKLSKVQNMFLLAGQLGDDPAIFSRC